MLEGEEENWNLSFTKSSDCSESFVYSLNVSSEDQCQQVEISIYLITPKSKELEEYITQGT